MPRPDFVTEIDVSGDPSGAGTWVEVSDKLRSLSGSRGAPSELSPVETAEATYTFDNPDGTFDDENVDSILAGFEPGARIRTYADGFGYEVAPGVLTIDADNVTDAVRRAGLSGDHRPRRHLEFWEGFENPTPSTGWSSFQGHATHGLTSITTDVREGLRAGRFEVRNGDVFSSGERSEVVRTTGYGVGTVVGQERWWRGAVRFVGPFTHLGVGAFELYHQIHGDDARFGQPPLRLQKNAEGTHFEARLYSGNYASSGAALAGTGASTDLAQQMLEFEDDVWFDYRYGLLWTTDLTGWLVFDMKHRSDSVWTRFAEWDGIQTLATINGDPTPMTTYDKVGLYRTAGSITQILDHDVNRLGHCPEDLELDEPIVGGDGSQGIWLPTTNLHPNGGAETNTSGIGVNGAGVTVTRVARAGFFGGFVAKVDMPGTASSEAYQRVQSLSATTVYTWQALVEAAPGERVRIWVVDPAAATLATFTFTGDGVPRVVSVTFTSTTAGNYNLRIGRTATGSAQTIYVDGAQVAARSYQTPYVETNGASATRNAGGLPSPVTEMDETQMWIALRIRHGGAKSNQPTAYGWLWGDSTSNLLALLYDSSDDRWKARRKSGGSGADAGADTSEFQSGDYALIVAAFTATAVKVSVNGRPFVSVANSSIPTLAATAAEFGSGGSIVASSQMDGDLMWSAWGRGTLTDADVAALFRRFGRSGVGDPRPTNLLFEETADVRAVYPGVDETYWIKGRGYVFSGFTDEHPETWPASGHDAIATITAKDGINLLTETPVPSSRPDYEDFGDVISAYRPTLLHPLNEPEGTKLVHHKRVRHRKRKKHVRRWTTRETRAEAEGLTGPPGVYHNTPGLGQLGLIKGSLDSAVRFTRSQSEWASVLLEGEDLGVIRGVFCRFKPAAVNVSQCIFSTPAFNGTVDLGGGPTAAEIRPFELRVSSAGKVQVEALRDGGFYGAGDFSNIEGTTTLVVGTTYSILAVYSQPVNPHLALYINGVLEAEVDISEIPSEVPAGKIAYGRRQRAPMGGGGGDNYLDGTLAWVATFERSLGAAAALNLHQAAALRGWDQELADVRIAHALDELGLWDSPYLELEPATREIQPSRQGGQEALDPIRDAEDVDSGRFFFLPSNVPKYLAKGWRDRSPHNVSVMTFGDAAAFEAMPDDVVPYRDVALVKARDQLILEARVTRVGSDDTQIVTSSLWSAGKIKPGTSFDVLTITDAEALEIATDLVARFERPQKRVERLELVGRDETWPAFFLDVGDRVLIYRNPEGAPQKALDAHVEGITFNLNPSGDETLELRVSPR